MSKRKRKIHDDFRLVERDLASRPELYREMHHLNRYGAAIVSDRVARAVVEELEQSDSRVAPRP